MERLAKRGVTFTRAYSLKGGDWEEITVKLPATGPLGIVRLYVPVQEHPVEIDWIELRSGQEKNSPIFSSIFDVLSKHYP